MLQYISKGEEKQIRGILDELAEKAGLYSPKKESYFRDMGYYLDRLWYMEIEEEKIPLVAFEIEKGIPTNERIRKDILNIVQTRAPRGYLITPHQRILEKAATLGPTWETWYRDHFLETFKKYRNPFVFYCDVQVADADLFMSSYSVKTIHREAAFLRSVLRLSHSRVLCAVSLDGCLAYSPL